MRTAPVTLILTYVLLGIEGQESVSEKLEAIFGPQDNKNSSSCECVPYYLCSGNSSIITDGVGLVDIRNGSVCPSYLDVCCKLSDKVEKAVTPPIGSKKGCGIRNVGGVGFRITGDTSNEAQFGEFPWVVAVLLESFNSSTNTYFYLYKCVGALIHPKVVLTAAHCINLRDARYKIRAGEWDTQTTKEIYPHQERFVRNIVVHSEYSPETLYNDVAVVVLESSFEITEHVNTLCLPQQNFVVPSGTRCFVSGWGKDVYGVAGKYQVILKKIDLPIVDHYACEKQLQQRTRLGEYFELDKSFVCAGGEGVTDACRGDGGSPLVCQIPGQENRYQQIGMVAWGIGCGENNVPGVNVNVGLFRYWIDKQIAAYGFDTSYYQF